jgi:tRNA(Ile)-lysidine synthase
MIHILGQIPRQVAIAVSGGVDSMAVLDFLRRSRDVTALHYNHGTPYAPKAEALVREYCAAQGVSLIVGKCEEEMPAGVSHEAWWRQQRYKFFNESTERKIITAHHLDDCVENWVFTSMHGNPFLIPYERDQFIRPFLTTEKQSFNDWCERKSVPVITDPSNTNTKYRRNYIRHVMLPHVLEINPGIKKTIRRKVVDMYPVK